MQRTQPQRDIFFFICNQTQPPWNVAESIPQSQGNAPIETEPMIKNTTHSSNLAATETNKQTKNLRCGNRKGLLGRNDQTHHRMGPKTMESIPPSKRNTQADIQLRTRQTNHQQETDGWIQIKHNPEHQPSRMSSKSTAYVPPKTASTPTKANTQTCSYLDFNQFLIRRITRNICLRLRNPSYAHAKLILKGSQGRRQGS